MIPGGQKEARNMSHRDVVIAFLEAYKGHRYREMWSLLDPEVRFHDFAFPDLRGRRVFSMWHWFTVPFGSRKRPIEVPWYEIVAMGHDTVTARYRAVYSPSRFSRVDYVIESVFTIRNGLIVEQQDSPTLSPLAFAWELKGPTGALLELAGKFQAVVQNRMTARLDAFEQAMGEAQRSAGAPSPGA